MKAGISVVYGSNGPRRGQLDGSLAEDGERLKDQIKTQDGNFNLG